MWIGKARLNVDLNNAAAIDKVVSTIAVDEEMNNAIRTKWTGSWVGNYYGECSIVLWNRNEEFNSGHLKDQGENLDTRTNFLEWLHYLDFGGDFEEEVCNFLGGLLPNSIPEAKSDGIFVIFVANWKENGESKCFARCEYLTPSKFQKYSNKYIQQAIKLLSDNKSMDGGVEVVKLGEVELNTIKSYDLYW